MPPTPLAPTRSNGVTAPTVQTRISRPCESPRIWMARNRTCSMTTPISRNKLLWREGIATIFQNLETRTRKLETRENLVDADLAQQFEIAEHLARTEHDRCQWIVGDRNRQAGLFADALVEIFQQRAAAGEDDAAVADVGGKFGRCALESHAHRIQNRGNAFAQRFTDF